jgi:hypothetical protein
VEVKYELTDPLTEKTATITLTGETSDSVSELLYEGDKDLVQQIQGIVPFLAGIYGHLIGERTSVLDLSSALTSQSIEVYSPRLIEGEVPSERLRLPNGVQT